MHHFMSTHSSDHNVLWAWVAVGEFLPEFVYFAAKIYHQGTLPSATAAFCGERLPGTPIKNIQS